MNAGVILKKGARVRAVLHAEPAYRGKEGVVLAPCLTDPGRVWVRFDELTMPVEVRIWELIEI
jgi:hypothetical protein